MSEAAGAGNLWKGLGLAAAADAGGLLLGGMTSFIGIGFVILLGFGVVQFAWLLPLYLHFQKRGQFETAKGILIGGGIAFLLNAGCWGYVMTTGLNFK